MEDIWSGLNNQLLPLRTITAIIIKNNTPLNQDEKIKMKTIIITTTKTQRNPYESNKNQENESLKVSSFLLTSLEEEEEAKKK
ncbi:hypothetical protein M0813_08177 [Anaeramoeba flamelloides]|uniref:Uncharacterized protein n=1 Tax=Anaeramoeba flamelloides TaxID=1746091 RepID=A0ABQ8XAC9_9EUKA|nr:hypothetical protein M0813_08177 [Anaeramoeba flamelloides]